jgi:hypothetical protein
MTGPSVRESAGPDPPAGDVDPVRSPDLPDPLDPPTSAPDPVATGCCSLIDIFKVNKKNQAALCPDNLAAPYVDGVTL